ncbi:MAG: hypothetical protein ACRCZ0_12365 [Cetobacterium sp.]
MEINDTRKVIFWILEKKPILEKYRNQLRYTTDEKPLKIESDEVLFQGKELLKHPKLSNGSLVEATEKDLVEKGIYKLSDGEFIIGEEVKNKYNYIYPTDIYKPVFNYEKLQWEEGATDEELEDYIFNKKIDFYNEELNFGTKANIEYICNLITEEEMEEVKNYIIAIDPFKGGLLTETKRPSVFDRYKPRQG